MQMLNICNPNVEMLFEELTKKFYQSILYLSERIKNGDESILDSFISCMTDEEIEVFGQYGISLLNKSVEKTGTLYITLEYGYEEHKDGCKTQMILSAPLYSYKDENANIRIGYADSIAASFAMMVIYHSHQIKSQKIQASK